MMENKENENVHNGPVRILHVLGTLNMGGAESRIMDLYRAMDREKVQFDFLVHTEASGRDRSSEALYEKRQQEYYDEEVLSLGGRIFCLPRFTGTNLNSYRKAVREFFRTHTGWAAVEGHMTSTASLYLPLAKEAGVPVTMAHARSAGVDAGLHGFATKVLRRNLAEKADMLLSCAMEAGEAVYGRRALEEGQIRIIPNAIRTDDYAFREEARLAVRKEFSVPEEAFVIGHVGRFDLMKNHSFLIDLMAGLKEEPGLILLLVGEGKLMEEMRKLSAEEGVEERVLFAGRCDADRTAAMYAAMDLFAFPSLYEGLPGTVIEAQASGLPCLLSDTITDEVAVTGLVKHLPLSDMERWKTEVLREKEKAEKNRQHASAAAGELLDKAGYNVRTLAPRMEEFYCSL